MKRVNIIPRITEPSVFLPFSYVTFEDLRLFQLQAYTIY